MCGDLLEWDGLWKVDYLTSEAEQERATHTFLSQLGHISQLLSHPPGNFFWFTLKLLLCFLVHMLSSYAIFLFDTGQYHESVGPSIHHECSKKFEVI